MAEGEGEVDGAEDGVRGEEIPDEIPS